MTTRTTLSRPPWWHLLLDLLFPPRCAGCKASNDLFCARCRALVRRFPEPRCPKCDLPINARHRRHTCDRPGASRIDRARVVGPHVAPLRDALHALKYRARPQLAAPLGELLAERWQAAPCGVADGIIPVPLHESRLRERGYNQAELLADALGAALTIPVYGERLCRTRPTPPQVGLSARARLDNVAGAFRVTGEVSGGRWLLVDDVSTSGATAEACAQALRGEGAASVWLLTLTRPAPDFAPLPSGNEAVSHS